MRAEWAYVTPFDRPVAIAAPAGVHSLVPWASRAGSTVRVAWVARTPANLCTVLGRASHESTARFSGDRSRLGPGRGGLREDLESRGTRAAGCRRFGVPVFAPLLEPGRLVRGDARGVRRRRRHRAADQLPAATLGPDSEAEARAAHVPARRRHLRLGPHRWGADHRGAALSRRPAGARRWAEQRHGGDRPDLRVEAVAREPRIGSNTCRARCRCGLLSEAFREKDRLSLFRALVTSSILHGPHGVRCPSAVDRARRRR